MIGGVAGNNDNGHDMPAYLHAEHAAEILKRAQYRQPTETEARWARRCLEIALAAIS